MSQFKSSFNFDSYNSMMKGQPIGLKLHLAVQMVTDICNSLDYFDNPLEAELRPIAQDLKAFRVVYKAKAEEIAAKRANPSERNANIDNSSIPVMEMAQMKQQFEMMQNIIKLLQEGKEASAAQQQHELVQSTK